MKFYHATTKEAAASIQKDGVLKAGPFGEVFLCRSPLDAYKFLIIRGVLQVSVFEVNLKRSEVTESHDHSEGFFQCKAYTHDGDIAVSDRVPVRTYDFQNLVKGYKIMKTVNAKGEAVYFNRAWKHGKETWVVQGIGETLVIGRDRQKRKSRTFTQLPQAEKYLARMGFKAAP